MVCQIGLAMLKCRQNTSNITAAIWKTRFCRLGTCFYLQGQSDYALFYLLSLYFGLGIIEANYSTKLVEPPQKKKKQSQGDMCNIPLGVLIQLAKIKRWLWKKCSTEMHPLKRCLFKLTRTFSFLLHKQHLVCFSWLW